MIADAANAIALTFVVAVVLAVGVLFVQRWQQGKREANRPAEALRGWQQDAGD